MKPRVILTLAGLLVPAAAAAQDAPWQGIWSADPDWCRYADRIGAHDPAPIRIDARGITGLESRCTFTSVETTGAGPSWVATMTCSAEGATYSARELFLLEDANTLLRWVEPGFLLNFTRCD